MDLQQMIPDSYALEQYGTYNSHKYYQYISHLHFQYKVGTQIPLLVHSSWMNGVID